MSLRSILEKDKHNRQLMITESEDLIKRWDRELAELKASQPRTVDHSQPLPRMGIDFAYGRPEPQLLREAGVTFVGRYLGGSIDKDISVEEVDAYSAAGIDIVTFFESVEFRATAGEKAGGEDARQADSLLKKRGAPADAPVIFTCDWEVQSYQLPEVRRYFLGCTDVLGRERVGVYGGYLVVHDLLSLNRVRYGAQTDAWSAGKWSPRAQLRQVENDIRMAGVECDRDEAVAADFGQWRV